MNPIVKLVASALPGEKKYVLFVGAGVSKDAGVPTAWDLMIKTASLLYAADNKSVDKSIDLEKWFLKSKYAAMEYSELIEKIYPLYPDQQNFLKNYLNNKELGEVHKGIAELARRGIIRAIITTNFDHYIEKALEEKGLEPQVISTDEDLKNSEPLIHCKSIRIYKPHGDLGRGALKNTPKDIESLSKPMELELTRILSEHGVIIVGYSGRDRGVQNVFKQRNYFYYPLFWVNPRPPEGAVESVLRKKGYTYIPCTGANDFIQDFFQILERLNDLAPSTRVGPTLMDLKSAFLSAKQPIGPLHSDFMKGIFSDIQNTKPDFTKFSERDDAIYEQITIGIAIIYRFTEAALLASKFKNFEAIQAIYNSFGAALRLYERADDFSGNYYVTDFDGNRFLIYELFVSFIAALIYYNNWEIMGNILNEDLFIERENRGEYVSYREIDQYIRSIDELRNRRLGKNRISLSSDILKEHFTNTELSKLISHKEFMEADYFLFLRKVCHEQDLESLYNVWCPKSCIFLNNPPGYIARAESLKFLNILAKAAGVTEEKFKKQIQKSGNAFRRFFSRGFVREPLENFDFSKLGGRP